MRFWRKRGVKLIVVAKMRNKTCAFGSILRIQRRSGTMRFLQICGVKQSVFAENAKLNSVFSAIMLYSRNSDYVLGLNKIFDILDLGLVCY